jgi:thiol-disulfide isomerase/thioredoxin
LQIDKQFAGTIILEPAKIKYHFNKEGIFSISGGKYNVILSGYLRDKKFIAADAAFRKITNGGNIESVKGTKNEWEMIQAFLRKEELRSEYLAKLVETNPDPRIKVMAALMCELQPDAEKTMRIIEGVAGEVGENTIMIRRARSMYKQQMDALARRHAGMLGEQYVDFTATTLSGESIRLKPIVEKNKFTLLQFWASWCGPCRKEIPLLKKLYTSYKNKGFEIVSFSMDDNKYNWEKASAVEQLRWLNVSDLQAFKSGVTKNYPIFGIPANVIIDNKGKIVASNLLGDDLEKKLKELIN